MSTAKGQRPSHRPSIHDGLHLVGKPTGQAFTDPGALACEMTRGRPSVAPGAACSESTLFRAHHQPLASSNRQPMRACVQCGEGLRVPGAQDQVGVVSPDTHSSILSGKPQQWRGSLSPCPVWMKLFWRGWLMSWADRPATEVTTFRGKGPTHSVRVF